jgi:hypothetical protein
MARPSKLERTWSDAQLTDAVADSSNWRNVMRKLGLNATSAGVIRIIAGRVGILLHTYTKYIVGSAAGLMAPAVA